MWGRGKFFSCYSMVFLKTIAIMFTFIEKMAICKVLSCMSLLILRRILQAR